MPELILNYHKEKLEAVEHEKIKSTFQMERDEKVRKEKGVSETDTSGTKRAAARDILVRIVLGTIESF